MDIKEIARLAGVSPATVSKVVNHKDASISQETRDKVNEVVRKYHYVPYSSALSRQTSRRVLAFVLREPVSYDSMLDGIIQTAQKDGYTPLVFDSYSDQETEEANLSTIISSGCAGILWEPVSEESRSLETMLTKAGIPHLLIGIYGGNEDFVQPYFRAAYEMTSKLIGLGHQKIGCLLSKTRRTREFLAGYRACLQDNDLPFADNLVFDSVDKRVAEAVALGQMTAVISSHFRGAINFSQLMTKLHYHIPRDVSIVSLQNDYAQYQEGAENAEISALVIHNSDFGSFLCESLISLVEDNGTEPEFSPHFALTNSASICPPLKKGTGKVVVVGSLNSDSYLLVPYLPYEGTTVSTLATQRFVGGKAANQAVGVAKLGWNVTAVGNVGSDFIADSFFREFDHWAIESSAVHRIEGVETGEALIFADVHGETMISLIAGANATLKPKDIRERAEAFEGSRYCLVQTEIPMDTVIEACRVAKKAGAKTVLKPASCGELPAELLKLVDYLVPNEREIENIYPKGKDSLERARALLAMGPRAVIVTLGPGGCLLCTRDEERRFPGVTFETVDDAGAGDAFISALVSSLLNGIALDEAVQIANYAGGYSVTRHGVIPSLIDRFSLEIAIEGGKVLAGRKSGTSAPDA